MKRREFLQRNLSLGALLAAAGAGRLAAAEGSGWQLGCFTRPFGEFSYEEALDGIAGAGFTAMGLMRARLDSGNVSLNEADASQAAEIGEQAAKRDLAFSATYYGGPPVGESLQAGIDGIRGLIENCRISACATILLGGTGNEDLFERYYEAVAAVCDHAAENGVALVLKPHGGLNATGARCREIVEAVDHDNFRIWYDPGNILFYSEGELDPLEDVDDVAGLVTGMCIKDFQAPRDVALNPGTGLVDFPGLMERLAAGGFTSGPLIVETLDPGDLAETRANAAAAREFLEKLTA